MPDWKSAEATVAKLVADNPPLAPKMEATAEQLREDDPLAVDERQAQTGNMSRELSGFKEMTRFHPFMRLFNVCARSMYLDEPKGRRMRMFSLAHPRFRKWCMIGDYAFTALCTILIVLALTYVLVKLSGFSPSWLQPEGCIPAAKA